MTNKYNFLKNFKQTLTFINYTINFYKKKKYKTSKHTNKLYIPHKNVKKLT